MVHVHMYYSNISRMWLVFKSGNYFVPHILRCSNNSRAVTNQEQHLIERVWQARGACYTERCACSKSMQAQRKIHLQLPRHFLREIKELRNKFVAELKKFFKQAYPSERSTSTVLLQCFITGLCLIISCHLL